MEFRFDGRLLRHTNRNPDGSEWTTMYEYDPATARLARMVTKRADVGEDGVQRYEYDAAGRLRHVFGHASQVERLAESYEHDPDGGHRRILYLDASFTNAGTCFTFTVEGTDSGYSAPGAQTVTTHFDAHGAPLQFVFSGPDGRILSRVEFEYDEQGQLAEERQTTVEFDLPPEILAQFNPAQVQTMRALLGGSGNYGHRRTHRYDALGRRIESRLQAGPFAPDTKTTTYTSYGDPVMEIDESSHGREMEVDTEGNVIAGPEKTPGTHRTEAKFLYEYDARGNWVRKTVQWRASGEMQYTVSTREVRALTYFPD